MTGLQGSLGALRSLEVWVTDVGDLPVRMLVA